MTYTPPTYGGGKRGEGVYDGYSRVTTAAGGTPMAEAAYFDAPLAVGRTSDYATKAAIVANASLTYSVVAAGAILTARDGTRFEVAASGASDNHNVTAGGVKLYEAGPEFSTRARLKEALARGRVWAQGTPLIAAGLMYVVPAGSVATIADLDLIDAAPRVTQFDATGDGATNDRTAFAAAVAGAAAAPVRLDDGLTFALAMTSGQTMTVPNGARLIGGIGSSVLLTASGSGTTQFLGSADDMVLDGMKIVADHDTSGQTLVMVAPKHRARIENAYFDGGVTDVAGAPSHIAHALNFSDNDADGLRIRNTTFKRITRAILKTNASTKIHRDWALDGLFFDAMTNQCIALNNPSGTMRGVLISNVGQFDNIGKTIGNPDHLIGGANVECLVVNGTYHYGTGGEAWHVEENTRYFVFADGVGYFTDALSAISAQAYNAGGAGYLSPHTGVFSNFAFRRATRGTSNWGLDLVNDGQVPLKNAIIANGVMSGWSSGGRMSDAPYTVGITNVMFHDGDEGFQFKYPTLSWRNNWLVDNAATLDLQNSGVVGPFHLYRTGGWDGTSGPLVPAPTVAASRVAGPSAWSAEQEGITCPAAPTDYLLTPLGKYLVGRVKVSAVKQASGSVVIVASADVVFDVDTGVLTVSNAISAGVGLSFVDFRKDSTNTYLAVRLNTGSEQTGVFFQAEFDGLHFH